MYSSAYYPLRTTPGTAIPISGFQLLQSSPSLPANSMAIDLLDNSPPDVASFLPKLEHAAPGVVSFSPGPGVAALPPGSVTEQNISHLLHAGPFAGGQFLHLRARGPAVQNQRSRDFWFEVEIQLRNDSKVGPPIVGGVMLSGFPYLPYYVTEQGEVSANYGLPREMQVRWRSGDSGFLDDETTLIRQEPVWHSGIHLLSCGPVKTDRLVLRFADFPKILSQVTTDGQSQKLAEFWGVLIPMLCVYTYHEDVRYRPAMGGGVLAAVQRPPRYDTAAVDPPRVIDPVLPPRTEGATEHHLFQTDSKNYFPLTAASLFSGGRKYDIQPGPRVNEADEIFLSQKMKEGENLYLYVQQADEHDRCLGGLEILGAAQKLVDIYAEGGKQAEFDLRIFELDPIEGVSPVAPERDPLKDKYATLIAFRPKTNYEEARVALTFQRPVRARYLALVFTCRGEGYLGLRSIELKQSAHVVLSPRKSRSQQLRRLNFRIVGKNLAEDYARLGRTGFKFSIEHVVAGECKEVLFEARSLYDLLQLSGARLYANQRYLEMKKDVSLERATMQPDSFDHRFTESRSFGWRRSESGDGVAWNGFEGSHIQNNPGGAFVTRSNSESRSRTEHIGFLEDADLLVNAVNAIAGLIGVPANSLVNPPNANRLRTGPGWGTGAGGAWQGFQNGDLDGITGMLNLSVPPISFPVSFYQTIRNLLNDPGSAPGSAMNLLGGATVGNLAVLNGAAPGLSAGLNLGVVGNVGFSLSVPQMLPTMTRTSATGSAGTVSLQASRTGSSFAQSRNKGYDESETFVSYRDGVSHRSVVRDLLQPGTVRDRTPGVSVNWNDIALDIVAGAIPLSVTLPATADKVYDNTDEWIRLRFGNGMSDGLRTLDPKRTNATVLEGAIVMDVWFDLKEEVVRDDY